MMGGSCSTQRRHRHDDDGRQTSTAGGRREAHDGCTSSILRRGRFRSGRLGSRFCGGSQVRKRKICTRDVMCAVYDVAHLFVLIL